MSKLQPSAAADPQKSKGNEASIYLPADVKAQLESMKITPSEKLVDVVRRLMAGADHRLQSGGGDTVTLVMSKRSYGLVLMACQQSTSNDLADLLQRSKQ